MKSSKFWLLIPLVALLLFICPDLSKAADQGAAQEFSAQPAEHDINYVCVAFKDFPFLVLLQLKDMAAALKEEIPEGLSVGKEVKEDQGYLQVSYQEKEDGVLLSMSLHRLPVGSITESAMKDSPSLLSQESLLNDPSYARIAETLKDLFSRFRLAWEQNRIPSGEEEIALWHKELGKPS